MTDNPHTTAGRRGRGAATSSQAVSWWSVHEFVTPLLAEAESWPLAGSPEWCDLEDTDPRKVAALFDGAQHWALRLETCQEQLAEASRDVSAAADWSAIATEIYYRRGAYIPREVA
ncbi:MAG TPA: DUF2742 domain-containing protein [Mycobacterium sp.]|nr:DUF2742 domain-containing protein [Mycobacterium sp.]